MNCTRYIISLALLAHTFLACMDASNTSPQFLMLIPKNQPDQPYVIPFEHAKQCQNIKNMFEDLREVSESLPRWNIGDVSGKDILNFVYYLQNIYNMNLLSENNSSGQQIFHNRIAKQMKSLKTPELL